MYKKNFDDWNALKQKLDQKDNLPLFHERQVWWGSLGVNIGHEEDGKNVRFNRPILVVKKFNKRLFWGVPLTTQIKDSRHYYQFSYKERQQCAMLTQLRLWDASRLTQKMGSIRKQDFNDIRKLLQEYLNEKP